MTRFFVAALLAATLAAPASAARRSPDAQLAEMLKGRVAEAPVSCITLSSVSSTVVVGGRAIVYRIGRRLYVNVPRARAETLRDDDIIVTIVNGGQLCRNDRIQPVDRGSRIPRAFLMLGDFVPYVKPARSR